MTDRSADRRNQAATLGMYSLALSALSALGVFMGIKIKEFSLIVTAPWLALVGLVLGVWGVAACKQCADPSPRSPVLGLTASAVLCCLYAGMTVYLFSLALMH